MTARMKTGGCGDRNHAGETDNNGKRKRLVPGSLKTRKLFSTVYAGKR